MKNLKTMLSSKDMTWETPQDFFDKLDKEFDFTLDPCATKETAKCKKFYTKEDDGLIQDWTRETVFCNPPYGTEIKHWVKKCYDEMHKKNINDRAWRVVMLIPARTDTIYFHEYIYHKAEIRFIKGRLKFGSSSNSAPFPSMLVIFNN